MLDIIIKNVSFYYKKDNNILENINITIKENNSVAIIGKNGSGKSTLSKLINGLLLPTEGEIIIGDLNTKRNSTAYISRKVGYIFQNPDDQIFHSTVKQEILFGLKHYESKLYDEVVELCGLKESENINPFDLSLSIRKFVTIASVLLADPDIIIMDEVTSGQDYCGKNKLVEIISWIKRNSKTLILITHDMEFVLENFENTIVMANHNIIYYGKTKYLFWNYDVMKKATLQQPFIFDICSQLGINNIYTHNNVIKCIVEKFKY